MGGRHLLLQAASRKALRIRLSFVWLAQREPGRRPSHLGEAARQIAGKCQNKKGPSCPPLSPGRQGQVIWWPAGARRAQLRSL